MLFCVPGDEHIYVKQMYWIPEELLEKRVHEDQVPYDIWKKKGWLQTSPGFRNDYRLILQWFVDEMEKRISICTSVGMIDGQHPIWCSQ